MATPAMAMITARLTTAFQGNGCASSRSISAENGSSAGSSERSPTRCPPGRSVDREPGPHLGLVIHVTVARDVDDHPVDGPPGETEGGAVVGGDRRGAVPADADAVADQAEEAGLGHDLPAPDRLVVHVEREDPGEARVVGI